MNVAARGVDALLAELGTVFARFGPPEQDSGNRSFGVLAARAALLRLGITLPAGTPDTLRLFVKSAGRPSDESALPHHLRARLLRRSARLLSHRHPVLPRCHGVLESVEGPVLLLDWHEGTPLRVDATQRGTVADPAQRLRTDERALRRATDGLLAVHAHLARHGWIAGDLYDGSLLLEPATGAITLVDVDLYRLGRHRNRRGRMFGSARFMAPEETARGAVLDHRTTVFVLGRLLAHLAGWERLATRRGLSALVARATALDPAHRFVDPIDLHAAWSALPKEEA